MTKKELRKLKRDAKKAHKVAKKLGWKKILILLGIVVAILLGFLGYSYYKYKDPFYYFKPQLQGESVVPGTGNIPNRVFNPISKEQYYKDINFALENNELRNALEVKINLDPVYFSYGDARYILNYVDEDLKLKGNVKSIYDGKTYIAEWDSGKTWNREHVWPCNKMRRKDFTTDEKYRPTNATSDYRSDLHNLRVVTSSVNSSRSDSYYDNVTINNISFFPNLSVNKNDDFRGDVARIIFYMALRYNDLKVVENPSSSGTEMGRLSVLKEWNKLDPVDAFEQQRNNRIYEYQGNRNPFIDYPELVNKLY